jgi:uncharacterized membrane protein YdjX (TVP38/TMEM64 family)
MYRAVFRECAAAWFERFVWLWALDAALQRQGLKLVVLLRLNPLLPYSALSYALGASKVV